MKEFRYSLEKGSTKILCPSCNKKKFKRYVDFATNEYLPEHYGRCDSEANCAYHVNPYRDGYAKMALQSELGYVSEKYIPHAKPFIRIKPKEEPAFIPIDVLEQTLAQYDKNVFLQNLLINVPFPFEVEDIEQVVADYRLGTIRNGNRRGAVTFPFIDSSGNIRTIQVKQFDEGNHTTGTDFLHSILERYYRNKESAFPEWLTAYQKNDLKVSCLFGAHLLMKYPFNPIALVEAPKTAIYGTLYFGFPNNPKNILWLAVYNLSSLNHEKCKELAGRDVYLFPDLSKTGKAFDLWNRKSKELSALMPGTRFYVSDLLEKNACIEQRKSGQDLADYLIKIDWREFRKDNKKYGDSGAVNELHSVSTDLEPILPLFPETQRFDELISANFNQVPSIPTPKFDPDDYKDWFDSASVPKYPIHLAENLRIYDAITFITGRLNHIRAFTNYREPGNRNLFINQLQLLRNLLSE
ncbi:DUF6371 domain-containing protein [Dyadobacter sp. CY107]|uniref:DUF6371 domain-containing protein n=1 Tax=Dyadobacter fanqingshengii TaxID=2906443 RepID=UPI001F48AE89|nr:DUF6371 domain-containing protein [Dyadobacter fanqingshengii]MCF2506855.1 DUF6371 domain-containing protein [Dyadobacter fanqingshengii]